MIVDSANTNVRPPCLSSPEQGQVVGIPQQEGATESPVFAEERRWFNRASGWIITGGLTMGILRGLQGLLLAAGSGSADALIWTDALALAGYLIILHGLGGLLLATIVRALGLWILLASDKGRPSAFVDRALVEQVARLGVQLDARPQAEALADARETRSVEELADERLTAIRRLIDSQDWATADERARAFAAERPDDPRGAAVLAELERAKRTAREQWDALVQAARTVNDPDRVLELYSQIPPVFEAEVRKSLDQDLAKWFLSLVHRRLRVGKIQVDVVTLASRVSESFGHTVEGASLCAALPTLRRSAGLCPRCAQPYAGLADACPVCLAATGAASPPPPIPEWEETDEPPIESQEPRWFVEPDGEDSPD